MASLSLGSLIFAFIFTLNSICFAKGLVIENFTPPKKEEVIWIDSVSVDNLKINFLKDSRAGKLVGRTFGETAFSNVGEVVYTIKSPTGAVFWKKIQKDDIVFEGNDTILFDLVFEGVRLPKGSKLVIDVFNKKNKLVANGEREVSSQIFFSDPEISDLSVNIIDKRGTVSFFLDNKSDKVVSVWPKIEIYNRDETELIGGGIGNFVGIDMNSKQKFDMKFDLPTVPQVYVLKAFTVNKHGMEVGGILKKNFLIKGFFAQIQSVEILDMDLFSDELTFVFTGVVQPKAKLEAEVKIIQEFEGSVVEVHKKTISVIANNKGRFKGSVGFKLKENADYFITDIAVRHEGIIIGKKHMEKEIIIAPTLEDAIEQQQKDKELEEKVEKVKWWLRKDLLVWGIVLFVLSLFAINNWSRLHKRLLLILIFSVFNSQLVRGYDNVEDTPSSTAWWRHPVVEWYYNPSPDNTAIPTAGFENFSKMRMNGEILNALNLDTDPLFGSPAPDTKPVPIVLINFKKEGTIYDDWFAVDPGDTSGAQDFDPESFQFDYLAVDRSVEFSFEVDIQDASYKTLVETGPQVTLKEFLEREDGEWNYTVYFCMEGGDTSCSGGQWYATTARSLYIDSVPPIMNLEHDLSSTQSLHRIQLGTLKTELATNILDRDNAIQIKIIKRIIEESKIQEKDEKVGERSEKTRQREDVIRQIVIINERLSKISSDLSNEYLPNPSEERDILEAEQSRLETLLTSKVSQRDSLRIEIEGDVETGDLSGTGGLNGEITTLEAGIAILEVEIVEAQDLVNTLNPIIIGLQDSIKTIKQTSKTNPVVLDLECDDGVGSECQSDAYHIETRGNFCDNADICDTAATRQLKLCDRVGNCEDSYSNEIDWYDPISPETIITFRNDSTEDGILDSNFIGDEIKAGNIMSFKLSDTATTDYRRKDSSTVGETLSFDYNENACGANANVPFFEDTINKICLEKLSSCANSAIDRGEQAIDIGGVCNSLCDEGYIYHDGICYPDCDQRNLAICLPGILGRGNCSDVDFNDWSPDPSTVQNGVTFTQENNCGNRREALGTAEGECPNINVFGCAPFSGVASFQ